MPLIIYKNKDGNRVPSVTTVLNQWGIKTEPLKRWAWNQGQKGISLDEKPEAVAGSITHDMVDCEIKRKEFDSSHYPMNLVTQAQQSFENFQEWKSRHQFEAIASELSIVSEEYQFGGTIDCVAYIDGKLSIPDWKTGKDIYEDHIIQDVAYKKLWEENFPEHPITGGYHILRLGKEIPMFDYRWYGEFPGAWDVFLMLRKLYDLAKEIKKLK